MSIIKIPIRTSFQEEKYFDRELQYSFIARCVFVYALYAVGVNARCKVFRTYINTVHSTTFQHWTTFCFCALDTKVPLVL